VKRAFHGCSIFQVGVTEEDKEGEEEEEEKEN
jgi:hypothetical protein